MNKVKVFLVAAASMIAAAKIVVEGLEKFKDGVDVFKGGDKSDPAADV
ncbi:hypothetical protein IKQ19_15785 [Candidatus Saccharibacteria bacterium]|jgi:hypothetical protein|nr:hypothetical protein [Candidatus Saccharibacteria bacterium]